MAGIETRFRTTEGAKQFLAAYDAAMALWPVPYETALVESSFGNTHVNMAGSPDLPPLVLIHGAQISSPMWYASVGALSQHFRIYAPDIVDQMGRSIPNKKLKTPTDCSDWLREVLDGLKLDKVYLAGHSQGGFHALNFALTEPQRVERLILLSPSGSIGQVRWQMLFQMLPVFVRPTRAMFYRSFQWLTTMPLGEKHPLAEQFFIGATSFKPDELSLGVVAVLKDTDLRRLNMPVLLLYGETDGTCRPQKEIARARKLISHLQTGIIAGGGHLFPADSAAETNQQILAFLTRASQS